MTRGRVEQGPPGTQVFEVPSRVGASRCDIAGRSDLRVAVYFINGPNEQAFAMTPGDAVRLANLLLELSHPEQTVS